MLCIEPPAHTLQLDERRLLVQPVVGAPPERGGLGELRARRLELAERRVRLTAHLQNYRLRGRQSFEPPDTQSALVARERHLDSPSLAIRQLGIGGAASLMAPAIGGSAVLLLPPSTSSETLPGILP